MVEWRFGEADWWGRAVDLARRGGDGGWKRNRRWLSLNDSRTTLMVVILGSHRPGESCLATTDWRCGAAGHRLTVSRLTETWFDVVVRYLNISRSSTSATGICGVVGLNGTTLVPPGSAHEFANVLRSGARRRDGEATARPLTILVAMASFRSEMNGSSPRRFSPPPKGGSGVSSGSRLT